MPSKSVNLRIAEGADEGLGRPLPVRLSRIERFEGQPRRYFDQKSLEDLANDIEENAQQNPGTNGQKTPVRVCKHSQKSGVFVLIGGERRWRAFGIIRDRRGVDPIVNCFIDTVNDERHHFREAFLDNLQREDLIPVDEAASYRRFYDESTVESHGARIAEIARMVKKSVTHVENYLYMHELPPEVKKLMDPLRPKDDRLTITAAIDIARSTRDPVLQVSIAQEAIERNLGIVEVRTLISIKTGKSGYGISGRMRKPSDDYKAFKNFVGGTLNRAQRIERSLDIGALYSNRDDERTDRKRDASLMRQLIGHLNNLLKDLEG